MKNLLTKARSLVSIIYNKLGDPRTKNVLLVILLAMTAFGIVAPDTATSIRDTVTSLAL